MPNVGSIRSLINGSSMKIVSSQLVHSVKLGDTLLVDDEYVIVDEINYTEQTATVRPLTEAESRLTRAVKVIPKKVIPKKVAEANLKRSKAEWKF
jgi:hypothetical protein